MSAVFNSSAARRVLRMSAFTAGIAALVACAPGSKESSGLLSPYRIDIPQGNYITREMLDLVQVGMARERVRAALGAPLLVAVFRPDRWDYVFRYQLPDRTAEQRRVTILFVDDRVAAIESDPLPMREDPTDPVLPGARAARARQATPPKPVAESPAPATDADNPQGARK